MKKEKEELIAELHAQLEWYTSKASEEEFDPKAVESILYLLDIYEPLDGTYTHVDEAWKKFTERIEINEAVGERTTENEDVASAEKKVAIVAFIQRKKVLVAAVLVILLLAVVGTTQVEAIKRSGFFYWLRQDEEGRQMITMPDVLESTVTESASERYYDRGELPAWCEEVLEVEKGWETEELLKWEYINVTQLDNYNIVKSCYTNIETHREVLLGVICYAEKVTFSTEAFDGYNYVEKVSEKPDSAYVYSKEEKSGSISYRICEFVGNNIYFVEGKDEELLKALAEKYLKK